MASASSATSREKDYKNPPKTLPRGLDHYGDWLDSIRSDKKAGSDFPRYGGPLTEVALLGAVAIRFPGKKLEWNAKAMQFKNSSEANALIAPKYREGWTL